MAMNRIHIHTQLDSTTLHLPEISPLVGKRVEIIVQEDSSHRAASEQDWEDFFARAGTELIDTDLVREYREFDRGFNAAPPL